MQRSSNKPKDKEEQFEVEKVVGMKRDPKSNKLLYLVQWKNSWEPAENMRGAKKAIQDYMKTLAKEGDAGTSQQSAAESTTTNNNSARGSKHGHKRKQKDSTTVGDDDASNSENADVKNLKKDTVDSDQLQH